MRRRTPSEVVSAIGWKVGKDGSLEQLQRKRAAEGQGGGGGAAFHRQQQGRSSHLLHLLRSHSSRRAASEHSGQEAPARMVREEEAEAAHQALHREHPIFDGPDGRLSRAIRIDR